jgi:hypothetical protein
MFRAVNLLCAQMPIAVGQQAAWAPRVAEAPPVASPCVPASQSSMLPLPLECLTPDVRRTKFSSSHAWTPHNTHTVASFDRTPVPVPGPQLADWPVDSLVSNATIDFAHPYGSKPAVGAIPASAPVPVPVSVCWWHVPSAWAIGTYLTGWLRRGPGAIHGPALKRSWAELQHLATHARLPLPTASSVGAYQVDAGTSATIRRAYQATLLVRLFKIFLLSP